MGVRDFLDNTSDLLKVIQLRNYFSENTDNKQDEPKIKKNGLKDNILKGKVSLYPTKDKEGYTVSGENILKVKEELKSIGAYWNEENKSVEISNDSYMNNIDKETKLKIEKDIAEEFKRQVNVIREKVVNKDIDMVSENGKYKVVGYTNDIKDILQNIGCEKIDGNFYIDKELFKKAFTPEITKLVDIFNNEYKEPIAKATNTDTEQKREKLKVEICIVDMKNKGNNRWIELPISRLNFSKVTSELGSNDLKITKVKANDKDIQKIFGNQTFTADTNNIHKFNVLTRKINCLNDDKLQEYKSVLAVEGLSQINDFIKCADELKTEETMQIE